jgi:hypothetical protein
MTARRLAVVAIPLLAYEAWTLIGWLADGPAQITAGRDHGSTSWYAARAVEVLVLLSVALLVRRRSDRDRLLVVGMFSAAFWDPVYNWTETAWLYSTNFLNVNDWFAHAPLVANPEAGTTAWPIVIVVVGYPLWGVGFAALVNRAMGPARRFGVAAVVAVAFLAAGTITVASYSAFHALDLMFAPGYSLPVLFWSGGLVFGALACVRFFRDADGRTIVERAGSGTLNVLAAIALCQLIVIVGWGLLTVPLAR